MYTKGHILLFNIYSAHTTSSFFPRETWTLEHNYILYSAHLPTLLCLADFPANWAQPNPSHISSRSLWRLGLQTWRWAPGQTQERSYSSLLFLGALVVEQLYLKRRAAFYEGAPTVLPSFPVLWWSLFELQWSRRVQKEKKNERKQGVFQK